MREPSVSVAIMSGEEIQYELYGEFYCSCMRKKCSGKYQAKLDNDSIIISNGADTFEVEDGVTFTPDDIETDSFLLRDVLIGKEFHWEQKENQRFLGSFKLLIEDGKLTAINTIPVELYLTSVISSEMNATSSKELLKAHSIISRSWLLAQIDKSKELKSSETKYESFKESGEELIKWYDREDHTLYDVCADDHCQRYQGITRLHAHNAQSAVASTRGLVLKYEDKICDTRFSKSCGGISESFENVWEPIEHPYLKKIIDYKFEQDDFDLDLTNEQSAEKWIKGNPSAFCNTKNQKILSQVLVDYDRDTTDFYRWKVVYTQKELSGLIHKKTGINFGKILDLVPVERGYSGRLIKMKIVGSEKSLTIGKELEIRKALSETHLYSSAIVVERKNVLKNIPQKFVIYGAGWGHGVGLCQIGAAVMGEMGYTFDEILIHYYNDASIKKTDQ